MRKPLYTTPLTCPSPRLAATARPTTRAAGHRRKECVTRIGQPRSPDGCRDALCRGVARTPTEEPNAPPQKEQPPGELLHRDGVPRKPACLSKRGKQRRNRAIVRNQTENDATDNADDLNPTRSSRGPRRFQHGAACESPFVVRLRFRFATYLATSPTSRPRIRRRQTTPGVKFMSSSSSSATNVASARAVSFRFEVGSFCRFLSTNTIRLDVRRILRVANAVSNESYERFRDSSSVEILCAPTVIRGVGSKFQRNALELGTHRTQHKSNKTGNL
jgi:hypothetical protein